MDAIRFPPHGPAAQGIAEMAKLAAPYMEKQVLDCLVKIVTKIIRQAEAAARAEEREACIATVMSIADSNSSYQMVSKIAEAIRARND